MLTVAKCSQFFHDVKITGLSAGTTYYYKILASNGTTESQVLSFQTAQAPGDKKEFSIAVLNDMGYTNAGGTFKELSSAIDDGQIAFAWHGGDISYADDWYSGILPCASDWPVCYNGSSTALPGGGPIPAEYDAPLPAGEVPNQGGPQGGDMNVIYESNWDLWQQWMNKISEKVPYQVLPGNHEVSCAEFDGPHNELTAYLVDDKANSTAAKTNLTYYSCPPSQRNFTAYQYRFTMAGEESGGVGNFWYSFNFGLAHFISLNGETDFAFSPEWPFVRDSKGKGLPTEAQTEITDAGPFGTIDGNDYTNNKAYQQVKWLEKDLKSIDRTKTPWVIAMSHRPMYSSASSSYQANERAAFEALLLEYKVDAYLSGHIHWYERLLPLGVNGTIMKAAIKDNNTYYSGNGTSLVHIINGMAGNIESHSTLGSSSVMNITQVLNQKDYGFSKFTFHNESVATWSFVKGDGSGSGDTLTLIRPVNGSYTTGPGKGNNGGDGDNDGEYCPW
jgi:hypothetical protein